MNELEMFDILQWWCIKSTSPYKSDKEKKFYQDRLDEVIKCVEKLDENR